ncbi:MAG: hypothetical protein ACW98Y_13810 [Candidatus Thorarchaeota archaeon]
MQFEWPQNDWGRDHSRPDVECRPVFFLEGAQLSDAFVSPL